MFDLDKGAKRFREIKYILTNGYTPKEKIRELEKRGIDVNPFHGQSQDNFYTSTLKNLEKRFCC